MSKLITTLFNWGLLGLLYQIVGAKTIAQFCLAFALAILYCDQDRMAVIDRANIQTLQQRAIATPDLQRFTWVTHTTIGLELVGFYLVWVSLGWSSVVVLVSQLWFNLLAGVQLVPESDPPIQPWGIKDRAIVLAADGIGLLLAMLYTLKIYPLVMAIALLTMVLLYVLIKYLPNYLSSQKT
jgi:hypothetical protein